MATASADQSLSNECRLLSRYLIGKEPASYICERYAAACERLLPESPDPVLKFSLAHPKLLGFLDAASGFFNKQNQLRGRLLILTAILEASPDYTEHFLAKKVSRTGILLQIILQGMIAVLKLLIGIPLLIYARKM